MTREIVGAFIFSNDDKVLLGHGAVYGDHWYVPGGGIEDQDKAPTEAQTRRNALIREILEETGIDIRNETITQLPGVQTGQSEKVLRDSGERVLVEMTF